MRRLLAVVAVATTTFAVYLATQADVTGLVANRVATCPVRISEECQADYPSLKPYETLRFPVRRDALPDGGVSIIVPRASDKVRAGLRDCIEVMDWTACDLDACATHAGVCEQWDAGNPFTRVRAASKHVIPDCRGSDGGWVDDHAPVDCLRRTEDGGSRWAGCNVMPRSESVGASCLNAPSGVVFAGEQLQDSL